MKRTQHIFEGTLIVLKASTAFSYKIMEVRTICKKLTYYGHSGNYGNWFGIHKTPDEF